MGLRIIYGRAGTGKSEYIYKEINEKKDNKKTYIITPEQFSFTAEQKLMESKKSIIGVEVITFNRLAYRVINEIGGVINTNLTKCGKAMLIYSILQEQKNKLKFLNKSDENIEICMRIISELKKHRIKLQDLKKIKIENEYLKNKIEDIIIIYEKFEEKIKDNYIDETDLLSILAENIDKTDILKNTRIYIDEFSGFTEQEYSIINKIIKIAEDVTVTFCADDLDTNTDPNIDIFYPNKKTYKKIIEKCEQKEFEKIELNHFYRFKNEELKAIEKYIYSTKIEKQNKSENVNLFLAKNYYSEIENVAKQINKIIKTTNTRYKDISIITKNTDSYSGLIKTIFNKYEIPVFIDEKRDLNQNIIVQYILSIIEILNKNFSYESIFNYLKTGFADIEKNDIFKLEKYCIKYGIKRQQFKKDFMYKAEEEETKYLNELRKKIVDPLVELKNKIDEEKTAKNMVKQIYLFLENIEIEQKIKSKIDKLEKEKFLGLIQEYQESYKIIINIFDEINLIFGEEKITIDKFYKIIKIGLKNSELGKIPATQDEVIVGDVDRTKSRKTKIAFIIGLNDGVFPSVNKAQGFLDDEDREALKDAGIEIAKGTLENIYDDNFNIYKVFTTAEEKLYLSYASSDTEGKALRASNLIYKIKKIFPKIEEKTDLIPQKNIELINEKANYEDLFIKLSEIKEGETPEKLFYIVYKYFKNNEKYKNLLEQNVKYINYNFNENLKEENIKKIYGNKINTSISKLEKYNSCPFSYYLQYVLKLKEREELKVKSLDTGSFMHDVINSFFEELNNSEKGSLKDITDEQIEKMVNDIIEEKLLNSNNYIFTATEKYKLLVQRLKRTIIKALKYIILTLVQSEFKLEGTEVEFGKKGKYEPITIKLENGKTVEITGKIDRIDIAQDENKKYVRIIDYKSSVKNLDYGNIYAGLQLQLITYLDAVCKIEDFIPAGILYFNLLEQLINSPKKLTEQEIENQIKKNFKMKGLILADVKVAKMQDNKLEKGYSELIPAYIDSKEVLSPKLSDIATEKEFEKLQNHINKTIKEISNEIFKGNIEIKPYYKNRKTPCEYCSYKSICGFDSGVLKKKYKYVEKLSKEEVLEKIK